MEGTITGQSVCNNSILELRKFHFYKINSNYEGINPVKKILLSIVSFFKIFILIFRVEKVYVSFKRSRIMMIVQLIFFYLFKFLNKKIILHLHGSEYLFYKTTFEKKLFKANLAFSSVLIVLHESFARDLKEYTKDIRVIENFSELTLKEKKQSTKINFTFLSNLIKDKGILELVAAFNNLQAKYKDIYLNIYGKDIDGLEDQILGKNINYYGEITNLEAKKTCLEVCDVLCLPTYYKTEAFPISIIEGIMMKCHIITTDFNYLYDIFKDDQVEFVPPKSVKKLQESMESYILNREKISSDIEKKYSESSSRYSKSTFLSKINKVLIDKMS